MILLTPDDLEARRRVVSGPLAGLADSLRADLDRVIATPLFVPEEKARLSRAGGRCATDGDALAFDPFAPRAHRCPTCGQVYDTDDHYRWWILGYQLWLAERVVHASVLHLLRGDRVAADFARAVLERYADLYEKYPNADNVLGPTRPFFSTYLESIWTLQLCVAASALDDAGDESSVTSHLRERVIAPSARLIRSYDEGASNRQVWNAAALTAAGRLLGDRPLMEYGIAGSSGISSHLEHGLLADGSWYEGENYHLFAHRGLWYGVVMAHAAEVALENELLERFDEGSAVPFLTALPDMTFPARRDSQHAVSLRQWRFAELAELGLAHRPGHDDPRLTSALHELYAEGVVPRGDTGRWRSTAEAERNVGPSALARTDLGWRSLLFALAELPPLAAAPRGSSLLPAQGLGVFRRDEGRVYVGLDYGHSGGGHGHPDRLNLLFMHGTQRWLDDMGTGSYVDPSLHWYRSTLAHNAPVPDGASQARVNGSLFAWEERGGMGWIEARVEETAPGVGLLRTLIVCPEYFVDRLIWWGSASTQIDLPMHADGEVLDAHWRADNPGGSRSVEDGYRWLEQVERLQQPHAREIAIRCRAAEGTVTADCFLVLPEAGAQLWRATAPGPPGSQPKARRFHFVRCRGARGVLVSVWSWKGAVRSAAADGEAIVVQMADGATQRHARALHGWTVALESGGNRSSIQLGGKVDELEPLHDEMSGSPQEEPFDIPLSSDEEVDAGAAIPALEFELEGQHYRRSEVGWRDAGSPSAVVALMATPTRVLLDIVVRKEPVVFAPRRDDSELDNEHPDVNSDGAQLYVRARDAHGAAGPVSSWILVPEENGGIRITPRSASSTTTELSARWRPAPGGWEMRVTLPASAVVPAGRFDLDLIINETAPGRERRRGQLVLSGGAGEYVYLRGDRQPETRLIRFRVGAR